MLDKMHENFSNLISLAVQLGAERNETSQAASGLACFCNCHHKNLDHRKIMNHHFDNSKAVKKKVARPSKFQCSFQIAAKNSNFGHLEF